MLLTWQGLQSPHLDYQIRTHIRDHCSLRQYAYVAPNGKRADWTRSKIPKDSTRIRAQHWTEVRSLSYTHYEPASTASQHSRLLVIKATVTRSTRSIRLFPSFRTTVQSVHTIYR
jgi:hypothetical protein